MPSVTNSRRTFGSTWSGSLRARSASCRCSTRTSGDYSEDSTVYVEQLLARTDLVNDIEDYYRFGNKPGELFAWGTVNGEFELCWELTTRLADTWTCVVADIRGRTGERYPGGMLDLLLDALGGTGGVSSLDYLREVLPTTFEPYS
ncbi:hypothetical protein [Micromonospora sp. CA-244673]|uniref:hypothetical protein n=1 Tax=Micromonospora sp. CA-244673 TaxID=3239958 RepID=UPI003D904030